MTKLEESPAGGKEETSLTPGETEHTKSSAIHKSSNVPRRVYDNAFKLHVVRHALSLPENNRHKPIARCYPGLTPVQVRKWIRNVEALENAVPTAKLIPRPGRASSAP